MCRPMLRRLPIVPQFLKMLRPKPALHRTPTLHRRRIGMCHPGPTAHPQSLSACPPAPKNYRPTFRSRNQPVSGRRKQDIVDTSVPEACASQPIRVKSVPIGCDGTINGFSRAKADRTPGPGTIASRYQGGRSTCPAVPWVRTRRRAAFGCGGHVPHWPRGDVAGEIHRAS
jgi:hypothetical protein